MTVKSKTVAISCTCSRMLSTPSVRKTDRIQINTCCSTLLNTSQHCFRRPATHTHRSHALEHSPMRFTLFAYAYAHSAQFLSSPLIEVLFFPQSPPSASPPPPSSSPSCSSAWVSRPSNHGPLVPEPVMSSSCVRLRLG